MRRTPCGPSAASPSVQLDTLLQSTFLDMFGELTGNGWEMVTVEDVARNKNGAIRTGPFGSQLLHSEFVGEGIRVLGIDNAVANVFRPRVSLGSSRHRKVRATSAKVHRKTGRCLDHDHGHMWAMCRGAGRRLA